MGKRHEKSLISVYRDDYRLLVNMIKEIREKKGIPQKELAKLLLPSSSDQTIISKSEHFVRRLDIIEFYDICKILNISIPSFFREFEKRLKELK